ncbi:Protein kinase of the Mitotic Exit Network, partial [Conglomerata obtusa]
MLIFLIFVNLHYGGLTDSFLDIIGEINVLSSMLMDQLPHRRNFYKKEIIEKFNEYKLEANNDTLDCESIVKFGSNVFVYHWAKYNIVIKRMDNDDDDDDDPKKIVSDEEKVQFNHKNIIRTYLCFQQNYVNKKITWVVMEYLPICIPNDLQLTEYQATFLAYDVISGLDYLHMNQIAHLDLHAFNILATRANKQDNG